MLENEINTNVANLVSLHINYEYLNIFFLLQQAQVWWFYNKWNF